MNKLMVVLAAVMLSGSACGAPPAKAKVEAAKPAMETAKVFSPAQAIQAAAKDEAGAKGVFEFRVASVGGLGASKRARSVFLNSEADYRDARNISVMLRPAAAKALEASLGGPLDKTLAGKRISVTGTARPIKVNRYGDDHKKTGETYTQTRIIIAKAENIVMK